MPIPPLAVLAPLLAGLFLLAIAGVAIFKNPNIANSYIALLVSGAVLCMAPTLTQFSVKGMGIEINAGLTNTMVEQGADLKRAIADLQQKVESLVKKAGVTTPQPTPTEVQNRDKIILIAYDAPRRQTAKEMEKFLLDKGYSANAIYTDFAEASTKLAAGQTSLVYVKGQGDLAQKIQQEVVSKFPALGSVKQSEATSLSAGNIQYRLF